MYNHAPADYICPICLGIKGIENDHTMLRRSDQIYQDQQVSAFVNSFWVPESLGHIILVPNTHFENLFDLPDELGISLISVSKKLALALKKALNCDGITTRQNNEPAGSQNAFHFHQHIHPRFTADRFIDNLSHKSIHAPVQDRSLLAEKIKSCL